MEHLTKSQIVLLTLFVSFVSSMATAIVVVTLMQQAPTPVLQTITNVVEKSIDRIVPTIVEKPGKTVVIKDEDLMVAAIERNSKSVVSLRSVAENGEVYLAGIGTIVSPEGLIVTDKSNFQNGNLSTTVNGVKYSVSVVASDKEGSLGLGKLVPVAPLSTSTPPVTFSAVTLGDTGALKIGQTAIVLGGREGKTVTPGIITDLDVKTTTDKDTKVETSVLKNIDLSQKFAASSNGAPIITLSGVVVGFVSIDSTLGAQSGVVANEAKALLSNTSTSTVSSSVKKAL